MLACLAPDRKKEALWETRKASAGGAPADEGDDE